MSSIPNRAPTAKSSGPGSAPQAARDVLHAHLRKTASFIRLMEVLVQIFSWIGGILALWLVACLIDHWLLPLPGLFRWAFWMLGVLGSSYWAVFYLLPLLFRRINLAYAAQRIEHLIPEFKNGLISWLELESLPDHGVPRGVMAAIAYRARRFIGDQDPSATVDTSPLIKWIGVVLLLSTLMVLYAMLSPKSVGVTGARILMPWRSIASPTRVEILGVSPGETEITQGQPLDLSVEVRGLRYEEPVFVRYSTRDGQLVDNRLQLDAVTEGYRYGGAVTTDGRGVEQEMSYWIEAGDAEAGPFQVRLNPLPTVVVESIQLNFPEYTRLPSRILEGGTAVEAVEGTEATIIASANQPMSKAILEINPSFDEDGQLLKADDSRPMQVDDRRLAANWLMQLNDAKENPTEIEYRIRGYNQRMEPNPSPMVHSMSVLADLPPEVTLVGPESRILKVTPTSVVEMEVRASDPDFGISKLKLQVRKNSKVLGETTLIDDPGLLGRQVKTTKLDLRKLNAVVGDRFQVLAAVQDNRHDPISKQMAPGVGLSDPLMLEVVGPEQRPDVPPQSASPPEQAGGKADEPRSQPSAEDRTTEQAQPGDRGAESQAASQGEGGEGASAGNQEPSAAAGAGQTEETPSTSQDEGETQSQAGSQGSSNPQSGDNAGSQAGAQSAGGSSGSGEPSAAEAGGSQSPNSQTSSDQASSGQTSAGANKDGRAGANRPTDAGTAGRGGSQGAEPSAGRGQAGEPLSDGQVIDAVREHMQREQGGASSSGSGASPTVPQEQSSTPAGQSAAKPGSSPSQQASGNDPQSAAQERPSPRDQTGNQTGDQAGEGSSSPTQGQQAGSAADQPAGSGPSEAAQPRSTQESTSQTQQDRGQGQDNATSPSSQQLDGSKKQPSADSGQSSPSASGPSSSSQSSNSDAQAGSRGSQSQSDSGSSGRGGEQAPSGDSSPSGQQSQAGSPSGSSASETSGAGGDSAAGDSASAQSGDSSAGDSSASGSKSSQDAAASQEKTSPSSDVASEEQRDSSQEKGDSAARDAAPAGSGGTSTSPQQSGSGRQQKPSEAAPKRDGPNASQANGASSSGPAASPSQSGSPSSDASPGAASAGESGNQGRTSGGGATSSAGGQGADGTGSDAVNQDYAQRTTEMVLDYLDRQRNQPDSELLEELNWTDDDLREFVDRWQNARDLAASGSERDRQQWQEKLRDLGLRPPTLGARSGSNVNDSFQQMQDSGSRVQAPQAWRLKYEAFQKALEQRQRRN